MSFVRLAVWLSTVSPAFRRWAWRRWYQKLARQIRAGEWTFMNYGFATPEDRQPLLEPEDEADRLCIQLYERVASPVAFEGTDVLEVGSGRGGGCGYFARYDAPASVTGIDFSGEAVAFSSQRHQHERLRFLEGDAEALPFPDASFDIVINVESSHCYGNVPRFFAEVARVLRPGGSFVLADLREAAEMPQLRRELLASDAFEMLDEEDITSGVAKSLAHDHARKMEQIGRLVPGSLAGTFAEFAALEGSQIFGRLKNRQLLYHRFALRRRPFAA